MTDYRPISRLAYCNEDHWRATVEVTDGANRSEVQANIDLNPADGTANPQMTLPNGMVVDLSSNTAFVSAFRLLPPLPPQSREENQRICSAPLTAATAPSDAPSERPIWWMLVPVGASGFSWFLDNYYLDSYSNIPGLAGSPMRYGLQAVRWGLDLTATGTYSWFQPQLSEGSAIASDITYGVVGITGMALSFSKGHNDPAAHVAIRTGSDILTARVYRHAGEGWGSLTDMGLGAALILLGIFAAPSNREVSERDRYVDPSRVSDHYNYGGDVTTSVPNLRFNLIETGSDHLVTGLFHGGFYLWGDRRGSPGTISLAPIVRPDGGGLVLGARF